MLKNQGELQRIFSTTIKLFQEQGDNEITKILKAADISSEVVHYDNWNGGTEYYTVTLDIDVTIFALYEKQLKEIENRIEEKIESIFMRGIEGECLSSIIIRPKVKQYIDWSTVSDRTSKDDLLEQLDRIKSILISVATGGPKIDAVNSEYKKHYDVVDSIFEMLKIKNPNIFKDLWDWYNYWKSHDFQTYKSRREFISDMYKAVRKKIEESDDLYSIDQPYELTGWERVDRGISEIRKRMTEAKTEEQFQAIGLLSRETIISLAQGVYISDIHISTDGVNPSITDARRMLDSFISYELKGSSNEAYRKYAKSTLTLANDLTHRRSASGSEASMCVIAVISLVNIIKVITNKSNIRF